MNGTGRKLGKLHQTLASFESVLVAFSGGVDSTFLLHEALGQLGPKKVLAVCAVSPLMTVQEEKRVRRLARRLGARLKIVQGPEMENAQFLRNDPRRCYWCKLGRFQELLTLTRLEGFKQVIEGSNADDIRDYRPGMQAVQELGIRSPLLEAGLTKTEIRSFSRKRGLETWDMPAAACLASRIPYGIKVDPALLHRIGQAEEYLHRLGFPHVRLRHHGPIARIEVPGQDFSRVVDPAVRNIIIRKLQKLGWTYVSLDLEGYTTGSLNRGLS